MPEEFGLSQRPTHDDRSSSSSSSSNSSRIDIDIDIETPSTSRAAQVSETQPRCQVHEVAEDDRNRLVVSVDVERRHSGYQLTPGCEGRLNPAMTSEEEEEDDEDTDSEASTSTDADEEQEPPDDRLKANGWLSSIPRAAAVALPSDEPPSFQKININSSTVGRIGPTNVYKGPVTIVVSSAVGADDRGEDRIEPKAIKDKDGSTTPTEKGPTDTTYTNGLNNGSKLSTESAHPLFPNRRARVADWCRMRRWTVIICGAVLMLLLVIILSITLGKGRPPQDNQPSVPAVPNDTSINNDPTIPGVRIVPRVEWGAQPPTVAPTNLEVNPPVYVVISHTATTFCYTQAQCVLNVRVTQTFHIESKGWNDIGYNFLVGGDGLVYEGRGWGIEGSHSFNYNYKSIGLSFIGTFNTEQPTKAQVHAAKKLIEWGVENGKISKDYKLLGHRQIAKTESPGEALYNIIKTWDHWSPTP